MSALEGGYQIGEAKGVKIRKKRERIIAENTNANANARQIQQYIRAAIVWATSHIFLLLYSLFLEHLF